MDLNRRQFYQSCQFKLSGDLLTNGGFDRDKIPPGFRLIRQNEINIDELRELNEDRTLMPTLYLETGGTGSRRHFVLEGEGRNFQYYSLNDYPIISNFGSNIAMVCILVPE